jgi:GntR family transcriptional repressor for pyruvate dehydrogenase complex
MGVQHAASRAPSLKRAEIDEILAALDRLKSAAGNPSEWIAEDTVFHATVVRSAGNPYLAALYESVHTAVLSYEFKHWVETDSVPTWLRDAGPDDQMALHEPIATAVIDRDPDAAASAVLAHHQVMLQHLEATQRAAKRRKSAARRQR